MDEFWLAVISYKSVVFVNRIACVQFKIALNRVHIDGVLVGLDANIQLDINGCVSEALLSISRSDRAVVQSEMHASSLE
jgi:hypothetical protein